jgi:hypothetical protein
MTAAPTISGFRPVDLMIWPSKVTQVTSIKTFVSPFVVVIERLHKSLTRHITRPAGNVFCSLCSSIKIWPDLFDNLMFWAFMGDGVGVFVGVFAAFMGDGVGVGVGVFADMVMCVGK